MPACKLPSCKKWSAMPHRIRQLSAQCVKCSSSSCFCLYPFWQSRTYDELEPLKAVSTMSLPPTSSLANVPGSGREALCERSVPLSCWAGSLLSAVWNFCLSRSLTWLSTELKKSWKIIIANIYRALIKCRPCIHCSKNMALQNKWVPTHPQLMPEKYPKTSQLPFRKQLR